MSKPTRPGRYWVEAYYLRDDDGGHPFNVNQPTVQAYLSLPADRYMDALEAENKQLLHEAECYSADVGKVRMDCAEQLALDKDRIEKLEAENVKLREKLEWHRKRGKWVEPRLTRAVELLREIDGVGHIDYPGICERIRAFLSEIAGEKDV